MFSTARNSSFTHFLKALDVYSGAPSMSRSTTRLGACRALLLISHVLASSTPSPRVTEYS